MKVESMGVMATTKYIELIIKCPVSECMTVHRIKDKYKDGGNVSITPAVKGRSKDQNAYMWELIDKLAVPLHSAKEDIYRDYIRQYGEYVTMEIDAQAVGYFTDIWSSRGLGWICEDAGEKKFEPEKRIILAYYGSSTYDTARMTRLIEAIIQDCKALGIETETPKWLEIRSKLEA